MRRLVVILTVAAIVILACGIAVYLKTRSNDPAVILDRLRAGRGDAEQLRMKFLLSRGDLAPLVIAAYDDPDSDTAFRAEALDLMFKLYQRNRDDRLESQLKAAVKAPEPAIRSCAVRGWLLFGDRNDRFVLIPATEDDDPAIAAMAFTEFCSAPRRMRGEDRQWQQLLEDPAMHQQLLSAAQKAAAQSDHAELNYLGRSVLGREIEYRTGQARQFLARGEIEQGREMLDSALALAPQNHQARISRIRYALAAGDPNAARVLAEDLGGIFYIPRLSSAPVIDGDPTDTVWSGAWRYEKKPAWNSNSRYASKPAEGKSDYYVGYRDGILYIAVLGYEDDLDQLVTAHVGRDSEVWTDDCVEIFIDPSSALDGSAFYQFVINAAGEVMDSVKGRISDNVAFDSAAKIFRDRGYWACEFAVAASDLNDSTLTSETIWGFDIFRTRIGAGAEQCALWPTFGAAHRFHLWPLLMIAPPDADGTRAADSHP